MHLLTEEREAAEPLIRALLEAGADRGALNEARQTPSAALEARGLDELADLLESSRAQWIAS